MVPVKQSLLKRNATVELDLESDLINLKSKGLKIRDKNDIYRFCDIDRYEDELEDVIFKFNDKAPEELSSSFCLNYQNLRPEISEYDSINFFHIRSNLTEQMEGLIIYTVNNTFSITIFYLAAINLGNYEAIVKFVVKKLKNVLFPKEIRIRVLHTKVEEDLGLRMKKKPNSQVKQIYEKIGFKISSITYRNDKNKNWYTIFSMMSTGEDLEKCRVNTPKPKLVFKCQVLLSNQVRLAKNTAKPQNRGIADFRSYVLFSFLKYLKGNRLEVHRKKVESLNSFKTLLTHFEKNKHLYPKFISDQYIYADLWESQEAYLDDMRSVFGAMFGNVIKMHDYGDKKIRLSSCMSKFSLKFKFCESVNFQGKKYFRIRPNSLTYKFKSKKLRLEYYMVQCDRDNMSVCFFPHKKFVEAYMKDKVSFSSVSNSIFTVNYSNFSILNPLFQEIQSDVKNFKHDIWIPQFNLDLKTIELSEIVYTFSNSLDLPLQTVKLFLQNSEFLTLVRLWQACRLRLEEHLIRQGYYLGLGRNL